MPTPAQLQKLLDRESAAYESFYALHIALLHHRYVGATQRNQLVKRMAKAERLYRALYTQITQAGLVNRGSLFGKQKPIRRSGLSVIVELSLDGFAFSNPAPSIPHGHRVWVRARISENHTGEVGIPASHELYHVSWAFSPKYKPVDGVAKGGRDEYVVSNPLTVTREFTAPATGSTKHNFFVYVDVYERID